jgi:hypothetical protein
MTNILKAYDDQFKVWQTAGMAKTLGPRPTAEHLTTYHRLGARHGKQCFAGAMALREQGVTGSEIVIACGAPQLNKMRGFIADALVKRVPLGKRNGNEIYKLVLTPKGEKRIATQAAIEKAADEAGAVTGEGKAKKATTPAKPAKKATSGHAKADKRHAKTVPPVNLMTEGSVTVHVKGLDKPVEVVPHTETVTDHPLLPANNV